MKYSKWIPSTRCLQASVCSHLSGEGGNPDEATQLEGGSHTVGNPQLEATELEATGKLEATDELEATVGQEKLEATAGSHQELAHDSDDSLKSVKPTHQARGAHKTAAMLQKAVRRSQDVEKSSGGEEQPPARTKRRLRLRNQAGKPKAGGKAAAPKGTWHCQKDSRSTIHSCPLAKRNSILRAPI